MKRVVAIALFLLGIGLFESCWNCGGRTDYTLTEITNDMWTLEAPYLESLDTAKYNELAIRFNLAWSPVTFIVNSSAVYACGEHEFYYITSLDSINVSSSKVYNQQQDKLSMFNIRGTGDTLSINVIKEHFASYAPFYVDSSLEILLNSPPQQKDTFQFTFQFFDTDGNIFQTTTNPVIITP